MTTPLTEDTQGGLAVSDVVKQPKDTKSLTVEEALQLLERINELVQTDFAFDMDCHALPNSKPFTQAEAKEMARIIGRVYSLAHRTTCEACRSTIWDKPTSELAVGERL